MTLLAGFDEARHEGIHYATAGSGPPLLLLHGYPQTHAMWHRIAPTLAERFTVVAPDLRGYGDSHKPPQTEGAANYAKRVMAAELVALMARLSHPRFAVCGHDRGGRVAYRMALDSPACVERLALLDIVPTKTVFDRITAPVASAYFHWFMLAQPMPLPETLLGGGNAAFWLNHVFGAWSGNVQAFAPAARAEYARGFCTPEGIHASCADYRAGAGIDRTHDADDLQAGRTIACPVLLLWGERGVVGQAYGDPLEVWRPYARDVRGHGVPGGHFLPEEAPSETQAALLDFFSAA